MVEVTVSSPADDYSSQSGGPFSPYTNSLISTQSIDPLSPDRDSLASIRNGDPLSAEDRAWVDSCLVDHEDSKVDAFSFKGTLLEVLQSLQESHDMSRNSSDIPRGTDIEIPRSSEARNADPSRGTNDGFLSYAEEAGTENYSSSFEEETGIPLSQFFREDVAELFVEDAMLTNSEEQNTLFSSQFREDVTEISLENAFLPNFKEDSEGASESNDSSRLDKNFSAHEVEPSSKDIFRVWDLGIPADKDDLEGELIKQFKKALSERPLASKASTAADSEAWKDLKEEPIDDLIAGIADLSLNEQSSR
uniref:Uncharacterized protein n=1 Tax=Rhizophora mucronata TaxID=61149 RepID=A0A2P2J514_RHIMU